MVKRFGLVVMTVFLLATASADPLSRSTLIKAFDFPGGLRFEFHSDLSYRGAGPRSEVVVRKRGTTIARYSGLGLDQMFASPHGNLFLALSNSGAVTPVAVFNESGYLIQHMDGGSALLPYCDRTPTRSWEWYDGRNPGLHFEETQWLAGITLNDCRGNRVNLQRTIIESMTRWLDRKQGQATRESTPAPEPIPSGPVPDAPRPL